MPIYTIAQYQIRPAGVEKVKRAVEEFVRYVKANEPPTRMYTAWQQKDDPSRFTHFFIFDDEAAHTAHSKSEGVKRFEAAYHPELVRGDVVFTDYNLVATNEQRPNTAEIKHQISIKAAPEKVYAAIATQAGLCGWWTADTKADEKAGGKADFGFDKRGTVFRMNIERLDPGKSVVWSCHGDDPQWNGTLLTWTLSPEGGGTTLRFTHSQWKSMSDYCVMCNSTWGELMYRLKDYVEGRNPGPGNAL
jgi:uncharacterized protein YndB with AHSA1/START domain/quinol monooxygenase YgiN